MASINTTSTVIAALKAAASFQERVADVRATLHASVIADKAALADALRPGVAKFYGMELTIKSTGRAVFPADHAQTDNARQALSKLVRALQGPVQHHTEPAPTMRIKATERSAYAAFLAACGGDVKRMAAVIKACKA